MSNRTLSLFTCFALLGSPAPFLLAQDSPSADIDNSKYKISGVINSAAVFVRSGASESDYATMKLDKGTEITAVGEKATWLKIVPPQGSFCLVAKAFVNRAGKGNVGQVTSTINVRVGSDLNPMKSKVATQLEPGQQVQIIGEEDEYFKITPPASVYVYVNKQYVDPIKNAAIADNTKAQIQTAPAKPTPQPAESTSGAIADNSQSQPQPKSAPTDSPADNASMASDTSSTPSTQPSLAMNPPTTQGSETAQATFDQLEAKYGDASTKPLDQQPVDELLAGYKALQADPSLPESLKRTCDYKVAVLQNRADAKGQLVEVIKQRDTMKAKQDSLRSEQHELEDRIKQADLQFYTACGTLRTSSLQGGTGGTLYRLTDPANGRTVVYLRSDDTKIGNEIGVFVGVKGTIGKDPVLGFDVLTPSGDTRPIDPAKVGSSIASQMMPASLMPGVTSSAAPASGKF